ncbi:hypothetical protein [Actinosynnema sp. NPDC020468]|uniref:hypothetical protein n=1 Tax=Actinosynnema sp. NPDC020468 TaxID=3154488 RepID=UPI0033CEE3E3
MIWFAWRQQRLALLALGGYALVVVAVMVHHRFTMPGRFGDEELRACFASLASSCGITEDGWNASSAIRETAAGLRFGVLGFVALAAVFAGAPSLSREWEQHTHLLALSQSVSPRRWFAAKVGVVAVPAVVLAALLGATYAWWTSGLGALIGAQQRLQTGRFEAQPLVMASYALFAVVLGVVVGLVVRRVVPAMAVTLVGWLGALYAVRWYVRPHYATPVVERLGNGVADGRWTLLTGFLDRSGGFVEQAVVDGPLRACAQGAGNRFESCLAEQGLVGRAVLAHPADRFWLFQGVEAGLFAALAGVLLLGAFRWLHHRYRQPISHRPPSRGPLSRQPVPR